MQQVREAARSAFFRVIAILTLVLSNEAPAHAGHDHRLKALALPEQVHVEVTLTRQELSAFSSDGNFTTGDLKESRGSLEAWLDEALVLYNGTQDPITPYFKDLVLINSPSGISGLKVRRRYRTNDAHSLLVTLTDSRSWLLITRETTKSGALVPGSPVLLPLADQRPSGG